MIVLGIDPGMSGSLAFFDITHNAMRVEDVPCFQGERREIDVYGLARIISSATVGHAFIEQVHAMPKQGVSSTFKFGDAYGAARGALAAFGIPMTKVPPSVWKRSLQVPATEEGARARASELLPLHAHLWPRKKDHNRAEAALIAEYGRRHLNGVGER